MIESLEQALLAAWSGLTFIPVIGHALESLLSRGARGQDDLASEPLDEPSFLPGLQYELESLP